MQNLTIGFIGGGNMAEALIAGLRRAGHAGEHIIVADPQPARREFLTTSYQVISVEDNVVATKRADLLVLAMKPQQMKAAVAGLNVHLKTDASVISIAAGVSTAAMHEWLGEAANIVRVMPNTPALVAAGMSVLFSDAGEIHKVRTEYLLNACGESVRVEREGQMHAVTALSGSGPAYFFLLAEVLQATGEKLGLPADLAAKLAAQTALGAGKMLVESDRTAAELRHQVTSPGGTTQAALDMMYEMGLPDAVRKGVIAASKRSEELAG
ncbi:pyrroline-5-carboxylate reductase [Mariprofundus aestuarium]|uniref:Pyrroline-5-carboxylate reductase n=1 Tax=Mariprofundus aestuarium TaxID=1921086 RepID=A0A2K8KYQ4_MARES|nr:pyrroline-5-carboxylate reductase [Mariprofundus aestuarium]ATX80118.1 pyrroline-5-carboxylate reductase [Mariprofundus aestuarium]